MTPILRVRALQRYHTRFTDARNPTNSPRPPLFLLIGSTRLANFLATLGNRFSTPKRG
jgi:hypothetical protein